jgi:hypothetical protein
VGVQVFQRELTECLKSDPDKEESVEQVRQLQDSIRLWSKLA